MKKLINIAGDGQDPLFIDPLSITGLRSEPDKKLVTLYTAKGELLGLNADTRVASPDDVLKKLAEAGNTFTAFPFGGASENRYVSTSAVNFATVTDVLKSGNINVIADVAGFGRHQGEVKPEAWQQLLDGIKAAGSEMLAFTPDIARSLWAKPAALYINPSSIQEMRDEGAQVQVYFKGSSVASIETGLTSQQKRDRENDIWQDHLDNGRRKDALIRAQQQADDEQNKARLDFTAVLAARNGALTAIEGTNRIHYFKPENYDFVSVFEFTQIELENKYALSLGPDKGRDRSSMDGLIVRFKSAAERATAFKTLTGEELKAPPAKAAPLTP